jgi:hypothetical protein
MDFHEVKSEALRLANMAPAGGGASAQEVVDRANVYLGFLLSAKPGSPATLPIDPDSTWWAVQPDIYLDCDVQIPLRGEDVVRALLSGAAVRRAKWPGVAERPPLPHGPGEA